MAFVVVTFSLLLLLVLNVLRNSLMDFEMVECYSLSLLRAVIDCSLQSRMSQFAGLIECVWIEINSFDCF